MIDNFALALTHGLLLLAAWRLLSRPDLDDDSAPAPPPPPARRGWARGDSDA
jgi:hypothetical protein